MQKQIMEVLETDNVVKAKLPKIIEHFVDFYGEEYREKITNSLNDAIYVFVENSFDNEVEKIKGHYDRLIENEEGEKKDALLQEKAAAVDYFFNRPLRRYRREFENKCQKFLAFYLKDLFKLSSVDLQTLKKLSLKYFKFLRLGEKAGGRFIRNQAEAENFKQIVDELLTLKGEKESGDLSKETKTALLRLVSIKKIDLLKNEIYQMKLDCDEKIQNENENIIKEIRQQNLVFENEIISEIQDLLTKGGFVANVTASFNPNDWRKLRCVCLLKEPLLLEDASLVHELNHIVCSKINFDGNLIDGKCGIVQYTYFYSNRNNVTRADENKDDYVALNEIMNDYLSSKIYQSIKDADIKVGNMEDGENLYETAFPLFKNFFEENLNLIKECSISDEDFKFERAIGRRNFEKLSGFATDFLKASKKAKYGKEFLGKLRNFCQIEDEYLDLYKLVKNDKLAGIKEFEEYLSFARKGLKIFDDIKKQLNKQAKKSENIVKTEIISDKNKKAIEENGLE